MATGAVNLALLIIAALKNRERFAGRSDVVKMIEAGKDIMAVPIRVDQAEQFDKLAKENKLACGYIHDPVDRDVYNVIIKTEDAQRVNEICKEAGIEVGSNIDEKKANADLSASELRKSSNTMADRSALTMTTTEQPMMKTQQTVNPVQTAQTMTNGITQEQANVMLTRILALRGAYEQGMNPKECHAALHTVIDELEKMLLPPEQTAAKSEQAKDKAADKSEEKLESKAVAKSESKSADRTASQENGTKMLSIRQRIESIKERAAHTPQHTKDKSYQPKHSISDLTK